MRIIKSNVSQREYILQRELGRGTYGAVYYSEIYRTKEPCAIKEIKVRSQYLYAIKNQVSILYQLNHPNIVKVYEAFHQDKTNNYYIIMEYCQTDLSQYIRSRQKPLDENKTKDIIRQIGAGLGYLYRRGIVHRDLKPANILVNRKSKDEFEFKLADFGLAKNVSEYNDFLLRTIAGTPLYMSPQILKKTPYSTKSDIWSAGIIFYELLVGNLPWTATTEAKLLQVIINTPLFLPSYLSEWSKKLLKSMLIINDQDRIGWQDLFKHINSFLYFRSPSNRPKSNQSNKSVRSVSRQRQLINFPAIKLKELLILDMHQYFDQATISKIINDPQYRLDASQIQNINELLSCYNPQLKAWFIKDVPCFYTCKGW